MAGSRGARGRAQPEVGGPIVDSASAGARRVESPRLEPVLPKVPKIPPASGGLERGSEIRHLLKDVLPSPWKKRGEDEEKKRAKKLVAVRIMSSEDTRAQIMEFCRRNLGERRRMMALKNAVYVEMLGDNMG